ncbi:hypothetical protein N865_05095 [Intrasporangium oryzae NRRL B-24470]|uniref:Low molecular weight protein antigen 6 PH domain-containing protein n=1 Tax=Intrasporangium oryzae NRRL B-24470 TaxID=1386089 RepID=W9GBD0_9MICO|nr:hypothetical protein N865_05095 [Intrasporangium oryzae NRRL B-24470]
MLQASLFMHMGISGWPDDVVLWHPIGLVLPFGLALYVLVIAFAEFRMRTLLEQDAVVVVHAFRRTRIPWAEVRDVRLRHSRSGRAWVELVRASSRNVVLPAPVGIYPVLKQRLAHAAGDPTRSNRRVAPPPSAVAHSRWPEGLRSLRWWRGR